MMLKATYWSTTLPNTLASLARANALLVNILLIFYSPVHFKTTEKNIENEENTPTTLDSSASTLQQNNSNTSYKKIADRELSKAKKEVF